jgi:hypothetical protein
VLSIFFSHLVAVILQLAHYTVIQQTYYVTSSAVAEKEQQTCYTQLVSGEGANETEAIAN